MSPVSVYVIVSSIFIVVIGIDVYNWMRGRTLVAPEIRIYQVRKKNNTTVVILGLTFLVASVLFHVNILRYRAPVPYSDINSISLKDFTAFKLPNQTLDGGKEFAFITTSIDCSRSENSIEIQALFHPSRSYVFNENIFNRDLLYHELYHFRITEIYARKIRQELSEYREIPDRAGIHQIIARNKREELKMQSDYDDETYHSYILKKQHLWQLTIDSLLSSRDQFKQTSVKYPHE